MISFIKRLKDSLKKINTIIGFGNMDELFEKYEPDVKKQKIESENKTREFPYQKKKVAMLMVYSGKGYLGMQRNPGFKTIEGDLMDAFLKSGIVRPEHVEKPGPQMAFQRAARTDKGVSAAGQVVSLKMFIDVENALEKINLNLPPSIRVLGIVKVTKGFDSKNSCDARTYSYLTPTFAFAPITENVTESYRITENVLLEVQEILNRFIGTHKFHNFTSGKKPNDPSAYRYIREFKIGKTFVDDSIEYVTIHVKGQSFMIHHIRKMIGLTMAIMRGYANHKTIDKCWLPDKVDVPKAPSIGLMLEMVHYDSYNTKFGSDGTHVSLSWDKYRDEIDKFKDEYIYPTIFNGEKVEKSMLNWLATLALHNYDVETDLGQSPMSRAMYLAEGFKKLNSPTLKIDDVGLNHVLAPIKIESRICPDIVGFNDKPSSVKVEVSHEVSSITNLDDLKLIQNVAKIDGSESISKLFDARELNVPKNNHESVIESSTTSLKLENNEIVVDTCYSRNNGNKI